MIKDPIKRFTLLVLHLAQQEHATELVIAPKTDPKSSGSSPIRFKIGNIWHDLSPPPEEILPNVVNEIATLAGFNRRPYPKEGLIDVLFSGMRLRWIVRTTSIEAGCVLTPIDP